MEQWAKSAIYRPKSVLPRRCMWTLNPRRVLTTGLMTQRCDFKQGILCWIIWSPRFVSIFQYRYIGEKLKLTKIKCSHPPHLLQNHYFTKLKMVNFVHLPFLFLSWCSFLTCIVKISIYVYLPTSQLTSTVHETLRIGFGVPSCLAQCLTHGKYSTKIWWANN